MQKFKLFYRKGKGLSLNDLSQINHLKGTLPSYRYNCLYYFNVKIG